MLKTTNKKILEALAAGPLEDLLAEHGQLIFPELETYIEANPEFKECLSNVWKNDMSNKLYSRIQELVGPT